MSNTMEQSTPYPTVESLPAAILADLTPDLQRLYWSVFNETWRTYPDYADREPFCHRIARRMVWRQAMKTQQADR